MLKIGVLISGRGSNLQAIIDASERGEIPAQVAIVISNKADAFGLERAKKHNIPTAVFDSKKFPSKEAYETEIVKVLKQHDVGLVCLAGYMKIVGKVILDAYQGKMINIHPSLLPKFPGLHAQKQALDAHASVSGVTVHFVDEGCDTGPIILQKQVPVLAEDTEETLSARILKQEHLAYPEAIRLIVNAK